MATLTDEQRIIVGAGCIRDFCEDEAIDCTQPATRDAIQAAVVAADQWIADNTASFVAALPEPFASTSTQKQKVLLFIYTLTGRNHRDILD